MKAVQSATSHPWFVILRRLRALTLSWTSCYRRQRCGGTRVAILCRSTKSRSLQMECRERCVPLGHLLWRWCALSSSLVQRCWFRPSKTKFKFESSGSGLVGSLRSAAPVVSMRIPNVAFGLSLVPPSSTTMRTYNFFRSMCRLHDAQMRMQLDSKWCVRGYYMVVVWNQIVIFQTKSC